MTDEHKIENETRSSCDIRKVMALGKVVGKAVTLGKAVRPTTRVNQTVEGRKHDRIPKIPLLILAGRRRNWFQSSQNMLFRKIRLVGDVYKRVDVPRDGQWWLVARMKTMKVFIVLNLLVTTGLATVNANSEVW